MAELTISADDITAALTKGLEGFEPSLEAKTVGRVTEVGDGIARVSGLPDAAVNELLEFEDGTVGLALNLDEESIGAVVLGEADGIEEGQTVRSTGRILSVPVGDALLGRVVNALGEPVDGKGPIVGGIERRVEIQAPGIMGRQPVHQPLQTGIKAIDAMIPIGRGQRELIIGDRKTGKTTVAVDTILNQKGQDVKCIYVAIGQKGSTVANTVETLREHGAMDYTVVVTAPAADPAPVQVPRPLRRLRHGAALDGERRARAGGLRRPVQAGRGLPPALAAAAAPAGPRGLPGRRVLPPQPAAGAGREAVGRAGRRLPDRAAGHRDEGGRRVGLHPDQRHLHHRRPDLPPRPALQVGRAAGGRRRHLGLPRRRGGADPEHEAGGRHPEARPGPVPRAGGLRHVRLRARRRVQGAAGAGLPPGGAAQAAPEQPDGRSRSRSSPSSPAPTATSTTSPSPTCAASRPSCSRPSAPATGTCWTTSPTRSRCRTAWPTPWPSSRQSFQVTSSDAPALDLTAVEAEELGEAESAKTLATE